MEQTNDYKEYWRNIELVPSQKEDKQLPFLIDTLKKELDINKIETVLEVGVGYGRVAKAILETFPNVCQYYGIDISEYAIQQSHTYLKEYTYHELDSNESIPCYEGYAVDFESSKYNGRLPYYDLVISVETMSVVPHPIGNWISKMVSLSKKYVVNVDFTRGNDTITNNPPHDYRMFYHFYSSVYNVIELRIPNHESIFIARVF